MTANFKCTIATPLGAAFNAEATRVTLPTESGEITVLANHEPLITLAKAGKATIEMAEESTRTFSLKEGVVEMRRDGSLLLLVESAEEAGVA